MVISLCTRRFIHPRNALLKIPKRNGYIVLIPELGEDEPLQKAKNKRTVEFSDLTTEKCITRMSRECTHFEENVNFLSSLLEEKKITNLFDEVLMPLDEMVVYLETTWSIAKTLAFVNHNIMPAEKYRTLHQRASAATASRFVSLPIFNACKDLLNKEDSNLTDAQRRILQKYILEGKLHGLELDEKKQVAFKWSWNIGVQKKAEFTYKVTESAKLLSPTFSDYNLVKNFPDYLIKAMAKNPQAPTEGPWTIKLDTFMVDAFLEHCPDRTSRFKVWEADVTKASMDKERLLQTSVTLEEIREREHLRAETVGYKSYADLSLETKMAGSLEHISNTFNMLLETARPAQEREIKELSAYANKRGQQAQLDIWDIPYWSRQYKLDVYQIKDEDIRPYLPLDKVLAGLFGLVETLYNVKMVESKSLDTWDQDVRYFDVFDQTRSTTDPVGGFYFDPYVRETRAIKQSSREDVGWLLPLRSKSKTANTTPLIALIFNFREPTSDKPCLLSFNAVNTLFQKFGKMLQHVLTTAEYSELSGTSNIEWDAAMIADYFMANWLQEPSVLQQISGHYDTGEPLPAKLIENLKNECQHLAGYKLCRELYLSQLDLELYSSNTFWLNIMRKLWAKYFVIPLHNSNSHVCSWSTIFTENWAAAYYSHLWSKMLAADLYSAFDEISINNEQEMKELAQRYRETFLAFGGTYPTGEVFRRFRGRDPSPQPLLSNLGLIENENHMKGISRSG